MNEAAGSSLPVNRRSALFTVFFVVLIDLMGFGLVLPLMPFYAETFRASPVTIGLLFSIYSIMQLVFSPIWGSLSDRVGRRPVMLVSTLGSTLSYVLFAFSGSLPVLFASRLLAGVMGGNIAAAQAYITDITPPEKRAHGMGLLGAAFGIGFVVGPSLATLLVHARLPDIAAGWLGAESSEWLAANRYALPGLGAALLSAASFLLVAGKLPETVRPGGTGSTGRLGVFSAAFWSSMAARSRAARAAGGKDHFALLMGANFLVSFAHASMYSAFPLFCSRVLGMDAEHVGMQYVYTGFIVIVMQGGVIRALTRRFREPDLFLAGGALMAIGFFLIPFSASPAWLVIFLGLTSVGQGLSGPTLMSMVSQESGEGEVGTTMGLAQGISGLGRVVGPAAGGWLIGLLPAAPFWTTAAALLFAVYVGIVLGASASRRRSSGAASPGAVG